MHEDFKFIVRVGQDHTDLFSVATKVWLDFILRKLDIADGGLTWISIMLMVFVCLLKVSMKCNNLPTNSCLTQLKLGLKSTTTNQK